MNRSTAGTTPEATAEATAEVQEVKESPSEFYGKTLTFAGEIEKVHGDQAFVLEGEGSIFQDEILVVTRSPIDFGAKGLNEDDDVLVTGEVKQMVTVEIEREMGWDIPAALEVEFRDKPVLMAESIRAVEETARWSEAEQPKGIIVSITAFELVQPDDLVGETIQLDSVPVQAKTGQGLWVGYQHRNMLLVAPPEGTDLSSLEVGNVVSVSGTIQKMPPADQALQRWSIDETLRAQVEREVLYIDAEAVRELEQSERAQDERVARPVAIADVARAPAQYVGSQIEGEAVVTKVISDRGFWLRTEDGSKIFAVVREDVPRHEMIDIDEGQRIRLSGDVMSAGQVGALAGALEQDTEQTARTQDAFIATYWRDVEILGKDAADGKDDGEDATQGR